MDNFYRVLDPIVDQLIELDTGVELPVGTAGRSELVQVRHSRRSNTLCITCTRSPRCPHFVLRRL